MHKRKKVPERIKGYALVSIIVISSFAMLFLLSLATIFLSVSRAEAIQNQKNLLIESIDSGLDYAVSYLNKTHPSGIASQEIEIPLDNLPAVAPAISVKVRLSQLKNYSGGVDWESAVRNFSALNTLIETQAGPNVYSLEKRKDFWVLCEITASRGVFSRSARVILEPQVMPPSGIDYSGAGTTPPDTPLFPTALFANSQLNLEPTNLDNFLNALDTTGNPVLQTNDTTSIASGVNLNADIVSNKVTGSEVAPPFVNGQLTSLTPPENVNTPTPPIITDTPSKTTLAPSPFTSVGSQISILPNSNVSLASTTYSTTNLSLDGTNSLTLPSSPTLPTKIIVDPLSGSDLTIDTSSLVYGSGSSPADFQIIYNGTKNINVKITSQDFKGLIYAPNATVTITGGTYKGAVVGNVINVRNSSISLQTNVSNTNTTSNTGNRNLNYGLIFGKNGPDDIAYYGYQPVTWQETTTKLVP